MVDVFEKHVIEDLISGEIDMRLINGYEVKGIHSTMSEFHIVVYDNPLDEEERSLESTFDGNRYDSVNELWGDVRVCVGLDRPETDEGLGQLFSP